MSLRRALAALAAVVVGTVALVACGTSATKEQVRDELMTQLIGRGIEPALASCISDGFFAPMSTDEVLAFQQRDRLTPAEATRIDELTDRCLRQPTADT